MGVDARLKHEDRYIAFLGRAFRYEDDDDEIITDPNVISNEINELEKNMINDLITYAVYSPKLDELEDVKRDVINCVEEYVGRIAIMGEKRLLAEMLNSNENLHIEKY